jgi:DNA-binding transcriptional regulator LsrR (DeoR family)
MRYEQQKKVWARRRARVWQYLDEKYPRAQIAEKLGISRQRVHQIIMAGRP